jgi:hypothetical protein
MALLGGPDPTDTGLILALEPANVVGTGTNWVDLSGTGNYTNGYKVGSMVNGISYNTSNGGCLSFDGSDDQVKFDQGTNTYNPISLPGAFTAMFWVKTPHNGGLFSHWSGGPVNLALNISSGKMNFYYYDGQWNSGQSTGTTVTTNNWVHLTWVRPVLNTGPVLMYVNGALDFSLNPRIEWGNYSMGNIGAWWSFGYFNGLMGPVAVYNRALSADEILKNYNINKGRFDL